MRHLLPTVISILTTSMWLTPPLAIAGDAPQHVVFTYAGDPSTTLTVNWQTTTSPAWAPVVHFSTSPREGVSPHKPQQTHGLTSVIDGLKNRFIHRVQLTGLQPNTTYYLSIGAQDGKVPQGSPEYKIRTIPDDDSPLRFVTGGDMGTSEEVRTLLKHAATQNPDFAVVGGDVAYANGKLENVTLWDQWLTFYTEEMVTADGYSIPLVLAVGNHETQGMFDKTIEESPFFTKLFGQDTEKNYFSRRFGKNLALLLLDSGHTATHESQVQWIRDQLISFKDVPYTAAVYHVPLYPSHRDFMGKYSDLGRQYWAPVFDEMNLTVAFENHDHTYKRTHLLKAGQISTDGGGTLYLGDGCWGRDGRPTTYGERWYLEQSGAFQHFWSVDVASSGMVYRAININNQVFDVYPQDHPEAVAAAQVFAAQKNLFILPADSVNSAGYTLSEKMWSGGPVTFQVSNPFDHPMTYTIYPAHKGKEIVADGFSPETHSLAAGASKEHTVSFKPKTAQSLPAESVKLNITVKAQLLQPDQPSLDFLGGTAVPLKLIP